MTQAPGSMLPSSCSFSILNTRRNWGSRAVPQAGAAAALPRSCVLAGALPHTRIGMQRAVPAGVGGVSISCECSRGSRGLDGMELIVGHLPTAWMKSPGMLDMA